MQTNAFIYTDDLLINNPLNHLNTHFTSRDWKDRTAWRRRFPRGRAEVFESSLLCRKGRWLFDGQTPSESQWFRRTSGQQTTTVLSAERRALICPVSFNVKEWLNQKNWIVLLSPPHPSIQAHFRLRASVYHDPRVGVFRRYTLLRTGTKTCTCTM